MAYSWLRPQGSKREGMSSRSTPGGARWVESSATLHKDPRCHKRSWQSSLAGQLSAKARKAPQPRAPLTPAVMRCASFTLQPTQQSHASTCTAHSHTCGHAVCKLHAEAHPGAALARRSRLHLPAGKAHAPALFATQVVGAIEAGRVQGGSGTATRCSTKLADRAAHPLYQHVPIK